MIIVGQCSSCQSHVGVYVEQGQDPQCSVCGELTVYPYDENEYWQALEEHRRKLLTRDKGKYKLELVKEEI